jgi:hypothetical protein
MDIEPVAIWVGIGVVTLSLCSLLLVGWELEVQTLFGLYAKSVRF